MSDDANLVKRAAEVVKKMQKLEVGQNYYDFMLYLVKTPDGSTREQAVQNAKNKAEILTRQAKELIALYKRVDIDILIKFPGSWIEEISNLATEHYGLIISPALFYTPSMGYDAIVKPLKKAHHDFSQVVASKPGVIVMFDNDHEKLKNAELVLTAEQENFNVLKDDMTKKLESWEMDNFKLKEEIGKLKKEAGEVLKLAKETLESAKGVSTNAAIDELAAFFKEQGEEHKTKQKHWLWTSIGVTAVLLFCLILFYNYSSDKWGTQIILQTAIKAFGFSLLLSVLIFCVKNYKAHGHNYIVNTHRVNSLKTYKKIVDGANSPDARDIIMANIAQHIFTPLDTGYVKGADSVGNPTMEIIRSGVKLVDGKE